MALLSNMRTRPLVSSALVLVAALMAAPALATTITIVNNDGPGEGFNDATAAAPVGGNTGVTRGQQRLQCFQRAATIWSSIISTPVEIKIQAQFNPLTCSSSSATLGQAGATTAHADFSGAIFPGTLYCQALANKLHGSDLAAANNDISATFNSAIDDGCFGGTLWYYGFDHNEGTNIDLLAVLLHEFGHGLGFQTFTNTSTGAQNSGLPDQWSRWLYDEQTGKHWIDMTNAERVASAIHTGFLTWDAPEVFYATPSKLAHRPELVVHTPAGVAGTYAVGTAAFGPALTLGGVTGDVVLVDDGTAPSTSDACEPLINGALVTGKIAMIDRGNCPFATKTKIAQNAGAIAVILVNNAAGAAPQMGGTDATITIPTVSLSQTDGGNVKAALASGVNVTMQLDATKLAGATDAGRALMYAPSTLAPGSSVSHWDVSASPNLLMEPFITNDLTDSIDLMHDLFTDIGWFPHTTSVPAAGPAVQQLRGNEPNPFTPLTTIRFDLATPGETTLDVFDLNGRMVSRLVNGPLTAGPHSVVWNGTDGAGHRMSPGVYLYRLKAGARSESRQMVLID